MPAKSSDQDSNLSQLAYQRCKALLLSATLDPGAVVSQSELSSRLDVPVTPLRDALRTLQAEGLVRVLPRSGIRIPKPDVELVRNTFQLRRLLEREGARRYTEVATGSALGEWEKRHRQLRHALPSLSPADLRKNWLALDDDFHSALIACLANPVIKAVYRSNEDKITLIHNHIKRIATVASVRETVDEHEAILAAFAQRDPEAAERAMEQHIERALQRALGF